MSCKLDTRTKLINNQCYQFHNNKIGTITPAGIITNEIPIPTANSNSYFLTNGPDGNIWFAENNTNKLACLNLATGMITEYSNGISGGAGPQGITSGPDGNIWFTEYNGSRVARFIL